MKNKQKMKPKHLIEDNLKEILIELVEDILMTEIKDKTIKIHFTQKNSPFILDLILNYLEKKYT